MVHQELEMPDIWFLRYIFLQIDGSSRRGRTWTNVLFHFLEKKTSSCDVSIQFDKVGEWIYRPLLADSDFFTGINLKFSIHAQYTALAQ